MSKKHTYGLYVHNDEYNSFEDIIKALMEHCDHSYIQAEQCATIIHNKKQYCVKMDVKDVLNGIKRKLLVNGIYARVESLNK